MMSLAAVMIDSKVFLFFASTAMTKA